MTSHTKTPLVYRNEMASYEMMVYLILTEFTDLGNAEHLCGQMIGWNTE